MKTARRGRLLLLGGVSGRTRGRFSRKVILSGGAGAGEEESGRGVRGVSGESGFSIAEVRFRGVIGRA